MENLSIPDAESLQFAEMDTLELIGLLEHKIELLRTAQNAVMAGGSITGKLSREIETIQQELRLRNI